MRRLRVLGLKRQRSGWICKCVKMKLQDTGDWFKSQNKESPMITHLGELEKYNSITEIGNEEESYSGGMIKFGYFELWMITIHKEVYTGGLGQNAEREQERRFGGSNKSMDRDDLESPERRLEGWNCHVAVLIVGEHGWKTNHGGKSSQVGRAAHGSESRERMLRGVGDSCAQGWRAERWPKTGKDSSRPLSGIMEQRLFKSEPPVERCHPL